MKKSEFNALSEKELAEQLPTLQSELMQEKANNAIGKFNQKTSRSREIRKMIARIHTKLNQPGVTERK